jgi:TPR repeat protein
MYGQGHGVDVNYKKAIEWYEKAAKQGYAAAQYQMGVMYENGVGVNQDDSMTMRWYAKAAAQGFEGAQRQIGIILARRRKSTAGTGGK